MGGGARVVHQPTRPTMKKRIAALQKPNPIMRILALDPSVMNRCGWAIVEIEWDLKGNRIRDDWDFGSFEVCGMNFQMRCSDLKDHIMRLGFDFDVLVMEWPTYY